MGKSTLYHSGVAKSSICFGWQVTLCDRIQLKPHQTNKQTNTTIGHVRLSYPFICSSNVVSAYGIRFPVAVRCLHELLYPQIYFYLYMKDVTTYTSQSLAQRFTFEHIAYRTNQLIDKCIVVVLIGSIVIHSAVNNVEMK